jgi:competence protein ComEC
MAFVGWLGNLPIAVWQQPAPAAWAVVVASAGCIWLLLPRGVPARWLGALLMLPLLATGAPRPVPGALRMTVLDVGQGLAVHVQTASHDLLYDTGPQFSDDADSGNRIILPYLRARGVQRLDGLVVTHQDKDHAGGAQSVMDGLPVAWLTASLPHDDPLRAAPVAQRRCVAGDGWTWDGVDFRFLHPSQSDYAGPAGSSNDMSCVLKVSAPDGSVLLTADIEAGVESRLLTGPADLHADIVVVPHHGSRSSSTPDFVAAVGARTAIFAVGYRSRFRHPHPLVVARYADTGAAILRTDQGGAITLDLTPGGIAIRRERDLQRRYWQGG